MSQFLITDVQELRPTVQVDPLSVALALLRLVVAAALVTAVGFWFADSLLGIGRLSAASMAMSVVVMSVAPALLFLRLAASASSFGLDLHFLGRLFLLMLIACSAFNIPFWNLVLRPDQWLYAESTSMRVIGYAVVVALPQIGVMFAVLRLFAWEAFQARHQAVIVTLVTATAYAVAVASAQLLLIQPSLSAFVVRYLLHFGTALLGAALLAFIMYQLYEDRLPVYFPVVLVLALSFVVGIVISFRSGITSGGISVAGAANRPMFGMVLVVLVAVAAVGLYWFLMRQSERKSIARAQLLGSLVVDLSGRLSFRQRWSQNFLITVFLGSFFAAFALYYDLTTRTTLYADTTTGITFHYPENWLIDRDGSDYIVRVRDMSDVGFKTTLQISVLPIGRDTTERNVADQLAISRAQTLIDYRQLAITPTTFNGVPADVVTYTFISRDTSPFLEALPTVVFGEDIIFFNRGQAIILTFRADASTYREDLAIFQRFLRELEL